MIAKDIQTLRERFIAQWDDGIPVIHTNRSRPEKLNCLHVRFAVIPGASVHHSGGSVDGRKRQIGRVNLYVFVPRDLGDGAGHDLIDAFADIFRHWRYSDSEGDLYCSTEEILPSIDSDPEFYQMAVSVPWDSIRPY